MNYVLAIVYINSMCVQIQLQLKEILSGDEGSRVSGNDSLLLQLKIIVVQHNKFMLNFIFIYLTCSFVCTFKYVFFIQNIYIC